MDQEQEWDAGEAAYQKAFAELTTWKINWDGEDSLDFKPETLQRAYNVVVPVLREIEEQQHIRLPLPQFLPGPAGGIDVEFEAENRNILLLFVPREPEEQPDYYGDTKAGAMVKGYIDEKNLASWKHDLLYLFHEAKHQEETSNVNG